MAKIIDFKTRQVLADLPTEVPTVSRSLTRFRITNTAYDDKIFILASSNAEAQTIFNIMYWSTPKDIGIEKKEWWR